MKSIFLKCCIFILFWAFVFISHSLAQVSGTIDQRSEIKKETARLEQYYKIVLKNALSNYYHRDSYLVDVEIELAKVRVPKSSSASAEIMKSEDVNQLPGLPMLPKRFRQNASGDSLNPTGEYITALQINRKFVRVVVDTSYTSYDLNFVRELVRSEAKLDPFQGDEVNIDQQVFPRGKQSYPVNASPRVNESKLLNEELVAMQQRSLESQKAQLLWYGIYGLTGLVLLLLILLIIMAIRRGMKNQTDSNVISEEWSKLLQDELQKLKDELPRKSNILASANNPTVEKDRNYITNNMISHPEEIADIICEWISNDEEIGLQKAADSLRAGNPRLLSVLKPHLPEKTYMKLKDLLDEPPDLAFDDTVELVKSFKLAIRERLALNGHGPSDGDLFYFLNELSNDQLIHLFRDESNEMIAIAVAQLRSDRAAEILQKIEEPNRTSVLVKMGKINRLSIEAYKEIANYFSDKALQIANMKYVVSDGVQSILKIIDILPVDEQEEYVNSIAKNNLELANRIRKYFVAFSDIPTLDSKVLQDALDEMGTETLVLALKGSDEAIFRKIIDFRAKREQQLITSQLDEMKDVDDSAVMEARKQLMQKIRIKLKTSN